MNNTTLQRLAQTSIAFGLTFLLGCATHQVREYALADFPLIEVFHEGEFRGYVSIYGDETVVVDFDAYQEVPVSYDRERESYVTELAGIGRRVVLRDFLVISSQANGTIEIEDRTIAGEHIYGVSSSIHVPQFQTFRYRSPVILEEDNPFVVALLGGTVHSGYGIDPDLGWAFILRTHPGKPNDSEELP